MYYSSSLKKYSSRESTCKVLSESSLIGQVTQFASLVYVLRSLSCQPNVIEKDVSNASLPVIAPKSNVTYSPTETSYESSGGLVNSGAVAD